MQGPFKDLVRNLTESNFQVTDLASSSFLNFADRFDLSVPYCGDFIRLRLVLNPLCPELPPDLVMIRPNYKLDLISSEHYLSLRSDDPTSVKELIGIVVHNIASIETKRLYEYGLREVSRVQETILSLGSNSMQTRLSTERGYLTEVNFCFSIPEEVRVLAKILPQTNRFTLEILETPQHLLQITISSIYKSPKPYWALESFSAIIRQVIGVVSNEARKQRSVSDFKRSFIDGIRNSGVGIPIEWDSTDCNWAVFYFEKENKQSPPSILHVKLTLPNSFPKQSPSLQFYSQKVLNNNSLLLRTVEAIKGWNERKSIHELLQLTKTAIFKESSTSPSILGINFSLRNY
mmetsp:Transcript_9374/g.13957  ORF Transcript_9374/g.13957 Transcript_9374/m.13957 type:complete len:347 (-) Transcript_9374:14-1054(-)